MSYCTIIEANVGATLSHTAIAVFTRKTLDQILSAGGSGHWVLDPRNAKKREFLVCVRNAKSPELGAVEPHGSAFLVGRIAEIVEANSDREQPRWVIKFSEYAQVIVPDTWRHWRNPVRYTTLEELGIELTSLQFVPIEQPDNRDSGHKLTIAGAKEGLAATFGVSPDAIEITIRG